MTEIFVCSYDGKIIIDAGLFNRAMCMRNGDSHDNQLMLQTHDKRQPAVHYL